MIVTVTLNVAIDKLYMVDSLTVGEVIRVKGCTYTAGGKGINVSKVAKLLGEEVLATGFIGGYAGGYIKDCLKNLSINEAFTGVSGETRSCINILDDSLRKHTEFLEPGFTVNTDDITRFLEDFKSAIKNCNVVTISGSVPQGADGNIYSQIINLAKQEGKTVLLDTSGKLLLEGIKAKPNVIKPNIDELRAILNINIHSNSNIISAAAELQRTGIDIVIVSLGKDGAIVATNEGVFRGTTPDIKVINTVGCGDSMLAGFAVGLSRGKKIEDTIRLAMAVSTANALTKETGYFIKEDYERLFCQVEVIKIED